MKATEALRALADLTAYQWGMVTSAQASTLGVSRLDLSRLAQAGHIERLAHGVYKDSGAPGDQLDDLRAAWLSTEAREVAAERLLRRETGVVVAGASAAGLHGIGDLWARRHEFVAPTRRQSQRPEIRYRQRPLEARDVTVVEGLPVMTIECTIADLFHAEADTSHIADALRDASAKQHLDVDRLSELLAPHARREGLAAGDGSALLQQLLAIGGIDVDALSSRVASSEGFGSRVVAKYLDLLANLPVDDPAIADARAATTSPSARRSREIVRRVLSSSATTQEEQVRRVLTPELLRMIDNARRATRHV